MANMKTDTAIPVTRCLKCGYRLDTSTDAFSGGESPKGGDVSMCLSCGHIALFNADLTLREPNEQEAREISLMPQVMQAQLARDYVVGDDLKNRKKT